MVSENPLLKWLILFWSGIALIGVLNINVRLFSTRVGFYTWESITQSQVMVLTQSEWGVGKKRKTDTVIRI